MPRRVDPEAYRRETPIFAQFLAEREGRYPGTPEGEEDIHIELDPVHTPEPTEPSMSDTLMTRLIQVQPLAAVVAIPPPAEVPVFKTDVRADPQETQPMALPLFVDPDEE